MIVTVVDAVVPADREPDLLEGFAALNATAKPEALLRSELLRGQEGRWRIVSTWRDLDSLRALRASGAKPAALELLEGLGVEHTHGVFSVEQSYDS